MPTRVGHFPRISQARSLNIYVFAEFLCFCRADDVDFFGGMTPSYVAPKQVDVSRDKNKPKAPMLGLDDDVDIDMDSWESGNARKHKKKGLGGTKI